MNDRQEATESDASTNPRDDVRGISLPSPTPPWTVLVIDDDHEFLSDTETAIQACRCAPDGESPLVIGTTSFPEGMDLLKQRTVDVVVLDVRHEQVGQSYEVDEDRGFRLFQELKELRFLPVVFFTAVEQRVSDQHDPPLVQVVSKGQGSRAAAIAVEAAFSSGAPVAVRALGEHVREVMRQYLWDHIGPKWAEYGDAPRDQLASLLAGRLAKSLEYGATTALQGALGGALPVPEEWHPSRMYVLPPLADQPMAGDIVKDVEDRWYVILTPSCDLVRRDNGERKAEWLLLTEATLLSDVSLFKEWREAAQQQHSWELRTEPRGGFSPDENRERKDVQSRSKRLQTELGGILAGHLGRYFHLPAYLTIPDLLVDLQRLVSLPIEEIGGLELVASLNPPYAQALLTRYTHYIGRVGLPDPDVGWLLSSLGPRST